MYTHKQFLTQGVYNLKDVEIGEIFTRQVQKQHYNCREASCSFKLCNSPALLEKSPPPALDMAALGCSNKMWCLQPATRGLIFQKKTLPQTNFLNVSLPAVYILV